MICVLAAAVKNISIVTGRYSRLKRLRIVTEPFLRKFFEKLKTGNYILNVDGYLY